MQEKQIHTFGKQAFTNLLVLLFCVAFISFHNLLFGLENSIVGVILLIGILMLIKGDLGFQVKQASLSIFFLFVLIAFAPKVSLMHPVLGLFVNGLSILAILILSSHDVSMSNHVPFMMGYIFCQGYDVSGSLYKLRVMSLIIGGILIAVLYYGANKQKEHKRGIWNLLTEFSLNSTRTRWYIKLTSLLTGTMFFCELLHYPKTMWVTLTVLSLTLPFEADATKRGKARIPGTILGTLLFYVLFSVIVPTKFQGIVVLFASYISMFLNDYFLKCIYNSFSALGSAVLIFSTSTAIALRIYSNLLGLLIALLGYFLFEWLFRQLDTHTQVVQS